MGVVKLTADSPEPPVTPGRVQFFGSDFNPYAQRLHMIMIEKDVPHDMYVVDQKSKPDWYGKWQPEGEQPLLRTEDGVITDEHDILKYLQDKYIGRSGPNLRAANLELLKKFDAMIQNFRSALNDKDFTLDKTHDFHQAFEEELQKRGTTFLAGDTPDTIDCMIWPWFERFRVPFVIHGREFKRPADRTATKIGQWKTAMQKTQAVIQTQHTAEEHAETFKRSLNK